MPTSNPSNKNPNSIPPPPAYESILLSSTQPPAGANADYVPHQFTQVPVPTTLPGQTGLRINSEASANSSAPQGQQQHRFKPGFKFTRKEPPKEPKFLIPTLPPSVDFQPPAVTQPQQERNGSQQLRPPQSSQSLKGQASQQDQAASSAPGQVSPPKQRNLNVVASSDGIETNDEQLNRDPKDLQHFFVSNCAPPRLFMRIRGHHTERRHTRRSHYTVDVTDFEQLYDLTPYIDPTGTIYTVPDEQNNFLTVPQLLEKYTKDENVFKSLVLTKYVQWDFTELQQAIIGAIRNAGFYKQITITFPKQQHEVSVHSAHCMGRFARNCLVQSMCYLSCLWLIACPVYLCSRHRTADTLKADFKMRITPKDWFYTNYPTIMTNIQY